MSGNTAEHSSIGDVTASGPAKAEPVTRAADQDTSCTTDTGDDTDGA